MNEKINIRTMKPDEIDAVAEVHCLAFARQGHSKEWIRCNFNAYPRMQYFVAEDETGVIGYAHWTQKSGFRPNVVLELEQIAVLPDRQGQGIGQRLIEKSLPMVREKLRERGATLKHIIVTTRVDNDAQRLYRKTLGVEVESTIADLFSADEVFMIARNVDDEGPFREDMK
jgi:ribosomal protein S18 acetylase RimI-like enzyme